MRSATRADILRRISERSKRLVWLNPEGRISWGFDDSEMPRYQTFCTLTRQCATAQQLERAVADIVAVYQQPRFETRTAAAIAERPILRIPS